MFNSINKYFNPITPNQIELKELLDLQAIVQRIVR